LFTPPALRVLSRIDSLHTATIILEENDYKERARNSFNELMMEARLRVIIEGDSSIPQ